MKSRLDLGFYKWHCRAMFGEKFPEYVHEVQESCDDRYYYIAAENLDGKVAKAKFRKEESQSSTFLMMYDAFFDKYITSERIA